MEDEVQPKGAAVMKDLLEATVGCPLTVVPSVSVALPRFHHRADYAHPSYTLHSLTALPGCQALRPSCGDPAPGIPT